MVNIYIYKINIMIKEDKMKSIASEITGVQKAWRPLKPGEYMATIV